MSTTYTKQVLEQMGAQAGVTQITNEEWAAVCEADQVTPRFAPMVALTRIRNKRNNVADGVRQARQADKELVRGIFLGSSDWVDSKRSLESTNGRRLCFLLDGPGYKVLEQITKWAEVDLQPGAYYECEIVRTHDTDAKTGRQRTFTKLRKAVLQQPGVITSAAQAVNMGVPVYEPGLIREEMKYQMVVVKGEIASVWFEPNFVGGEPDEEHPMHLYHNNVPCFQFQLVGEGPTRVKLRLKPTKNGKPFIVFQDLDKVASVNDIDELINSLVGRTVVAGGTVTRFNAGETSWADLNVHFLMEADNIAQPQNHGAPVQRGVDFGALLAEHQASPSPVNGGDWFPQVVPQPAAPAQAPVVYPPQTESPQWPQPPTVPPLGQPPSQWTTVPPTTNVLPAPVQPAVVVPPQTVVPPAAPAAPVWAPSPPAVDPVPAWTPSPTPVVPVQPPVAPVAPIAPVVQPTPAPSSPSGMIEVAKQRVAQLYPVYNKEITVQIVKDQKVVEDLNMSDIVLERVILNFLHEQGHTEITLDQIKSVQ